MVVLPFKIKRFWYCPLPLVAPVIFHVPEPDAPVTKKAPPAPPLVPSKVTSALLTMPPDKSLSTVVDGASFKLPKLTVVAPV